METRRELAAGAGRIGDRAEVEEHRRQVVGLEGVHGGAEVLPVGQGVRAVGDVHDRVDGLHGRSDDEHLADEGVGRVAGDLELGSLVRLDREVVAGVRREIGDGRRGRGLVLDLER